MIEVRNLVKVFEARGHEVRAVDNVTTQVKRGEVVVVIGPSGSGKSTFLRCLNGLEELDSGSVSIDGVDLEGPEAEAKGYGYGCRVYSHNTQRAGWPSVEQIRSALQERIAH